MALLLETTVGDIVIDLDVDGSPEPCRNILKLAKARYYTSTLIYNVIFNRYCQLGDPRGDGTGGGCIYALLNDEEDITKSTARFLKSSKGRVLTEDECRQRGIVVATEMNGIRDTIGSQFLITLEGGDDRGLDGYIPSHFNSNNKPTYLSLGRVTEDDDGVLDKINNCYCDAQGRPYADIRIERALVIHDPFEDPPGFQELLQKRGISIHEDHNVTDSPSYERPPDEVVEVRISAKQVDEMEDEDEELNAQRQEQIAQKEDKSRAVVLEMLGDLPSAGTCSSYSSDLVASDTMERVCHIASFSLTCVYIYYLCRYQGTGKCLVCVQVEFHYTR
jgi:peptidyl-prolyl cis-trans isomerase-like 4